MQKIRWLFLIVAILLMLAMALQNNEPVEIHLLWLQQPFPLSVLLLTTGATGFLVGALLTASMLRGHAKKKAEKQKTTAETTATPQPPPNPLS
jgi:uncharacterized integral membrane protein